MTKFDVDQLKSLRTDGFVKLNGLFDRALIAECRAELEGAVARGQSPHILTSASSVHVHNFFLYGARLRRLLFGPEMQTVHKSLFGASYCLRNAVASSIQTNAGEDNKLHNPIGAGWHRDTPQFNDTEGQSKVVGPGMTYQLIVAVDPSSPANSTKVLPGSHLAPLPGHRLNPSDAERLVSGSTDLLLEPGDVGIIDDNTFHRAGVATDQSRWMLFCSYTPWYVKPYFEFSAVDLPDMTPYEAHCLHKTTTPPLPLEPLRNTVMPNRWEDAV